MSTRTKISIFAIAVLLLTATACRSSGSSDPLANSGTMAGYWLDENKMVTTIDVQGEGFIATRVDYTLASTIQHYMQSATSENVVLTWTYWTPTKPGITTMATVSYDKGTDTLLVNWSNDRGGSGQMTLTRIEKPPYEVNVDTTCIDKLPDKANNIETRGPWLAIS